MYNFTKVDMLSETVDVIKRKKFSAKNSGSRILQGVKFYNSSYKNGRSPITCRTIHRAACDNRGRVSPTSIRSIHVSALRSIFSARRCI